MIEYTRKKNYLLFFFQIKEIKMRYPKTPDLDIISGVHVIRSLHVKKKNNKSCNSTFNSMLDIYTDRKESQKPTWLVFDKQVSKY